MAVTLTVAELRSAMRLGNSVDETTEATRLLAYATEAISRHLGTAYAGAPEAVVNEAAIRLGSYLFDQPSTSRGPGYSNAIRNSGAATILLPYRLHTAGSIGAATEAATEAGSADNPVTNVSVNAAAGTLTVSFADGTTATHPLPAGMGGLDQAAVDARIQAGVEDWAEAGNTSAIPVGKLTNAPSGVDQTARDAAAAAQTAADTAGTAATGAQTTADAAAAAAATAQGDATRAITGTNDNFALIAGKQNQLMPPNTVEAEAGTATTIRGWTAALVRAAINAVVPAWARSGNTDLIPNDKLPATGGGLNQAQVDARVAAGVQDWAEAGNAELIPISKLDADTPTAAAVRVGWVTGNVFSPANLATVGQTGAAITIPDPNVAEGIAVRLGVWVAVDAAAKVSDILLNGESELGATGEFATASTALTVGGVDGRLWASDLSGDNTTFADFPILVRLAAVTLADRIDERAHAQALAVTADWAEAGNTDPIPADKLTNAGGGGSADPVPIGAVVEETSRTTFTFPTATRASFVEAWNAETYPAFLFLFHDSQSASTQNYRQLLVSRAGMPDIDAVNRRVQAVFANWGTDLESDAHLLMSTGTLQIAGADANFFNNGETCRIYGLPGGGGAGGAGGQTAEQVQAAIAAAIAVHAAIEDAHHAIPATPSNAYATAYQQVVAGAAAPNPPGGGQYNGSAWSGLGDWSLTTATAAAGMDTYALSLAASRTVAGAWNVTTGQAVKLADGADPTPLTVNYFTANFQPTSDPAAAFYTQLIVNGVAGPITPAAGAPLEGHVLWTGELPSAEGQFPNTELSIPLTALYEYETLTVDLSIGKDHTEDGRDLPYFVERHLLAAHDIHPVAYASRNTASQSSVLVGHKGMGFSEGTHAQTICALFHNENLRMKDQFGGFPDSWAFNFVRPETDNSFTRRAGTLHVFKKKNGYALPMHMTVRLLRV